MTKETKLILLTSLFIAAILAANTLASKLFVVGGRVMTAGIIAFPITFMVTDIINDVWGRKTAQRVVLAGLAANLVMLLLYQLGNILPAAGFWPHQDAFSTILGAVPRIVLASMVAYLISQTWDVWVFDAVKRKFRHGLWLRNNLSTITSQAIDSAIFLTIAFIGTMPFQAMLSMYVTYLITKLMIALIDTPFVYLGVRWAEDKNGEGISNDTIRAVLNSQD